MTDFTMFAGDTKILAITVLDGDGAAVDLTDVTSIRWHMSRSANARPAALEKSIGNGIEVLSSPSDGQFTITIDSEDTEDLRGAFYHEIEVIDASDSVATVLSGAVTILPALIKPE